MQIQILCLLFVIMNSASNEPYTEDDIYASQKELGNFEFEPIRNAKYNEKISLSKNIDCDNFLGYASKCRLDAAKIYNSSRMAPPLPLKIKDWCKAIKHLTNCAIDWNSDCKDFTDHHFNVESTNGQIHVVNNICDNYLFLKRYEKSLICIESSLNSWQSCYIALDNIIETQKTKAKEWTHYKIHFLLCCARARFRRCTLESLFDSTQSNCTHEQAVILQQFSIIVSEGAVFQDCDKNMMYENCPDGDPRPSRRTLEKLIHPEAFSVATKTSITIFTYFIFFTINFVCV